MITVKDLYDLSHTVVGAYLSDFEYPWEALGGIKDQILRLGAELSADEYTEREPHVWVHRAAKVAPTAYLGAPCIICAGAEIRHCAFIRGSAVVGEHCVVGNSVELKNAILFDNAQVPHFNYVGDSIIGYRAHMGAGAITSNVKSDKTLVVVKSGTAQIATGLKKFGAMIGDGAEIGCNSVLNPGTVIGRNAMVYPLSCVRGVVPADSILKSDGTVVPKA